MGGAIDATSGVWDLTVASLPQLLRQLSPSPLTALNGSGGLGNDSNLLLTGRLSRGMQSGGDLLLRSYPFSDGPFWREIFPGADFFSDGSVWRGLRDSLQYPGLSRDVCATVMTTGLVVAWLRLFDLLARRNLVERKLSRKVLHITIGLFFVFVCWPLFSAYPQARFFAAAAPVVTAVQLLLLGLGVTRSDGIVKSMSRSGSKSELLSGPLCYAVTIMLMTVVFWRTSPVGMLALVIMCGGDGVADIVGRRCGSWKLPWNEQKSWAGSAAMLFCGFVLSLIYLWFFCFLGFFSCPIPSHPLLRVFLINLGATVVESLPINGYLDDNISVPVTAVLLSKLLLASA
ncbi:unnamed protein product [Closterium sp. Yama58-4]|nr:unnamed protein product [Closterium sp. Yama58-4]